MHITIKKTLAQIERCLPDAGAPDTARLQKAYELTLRLQSQLLAVIYDREAFSAPARQERLAVRRSEGRNTDGVVTLLIREPLPSVKRLTEALEEHWKAALHTAIARAAKPGPLPYFEKAMVEIEIVTPKGSDNSRVWDTSNRALQVILNNLKGIFFPDDDMEHMAFSVTGRWGAEGVTVIRISAFRGLEAPEQGRVDVQNPGIFSQNPASLDASP